MLEKMPYWALQKVICFAVRFRNNSVEDVYKVTTTSIDQFYVYTVSNLIKNIWGSGSVRRCKIGL